jgi:RNAse (barnase) inhibitor barstar
MTNDDLRSLLSRPLSGGVVRVARADDLELRLVEAGWSVASLQPFDDLPGFYTEIAARLDFPHYFGRNLDALWDCLRGVGEPTAVLVPWQRFADQHRASAGRLLSVLSERAKSEPPFAVILF